jgi:hypothetical protein
VRLFFHLVSKNMFVPDPEGVEVADLRQAQALALEYVREIQGDDPSIIRGWTFRVTDAAGVVVLLLDLGQIHVLDRPMRHSI